ncbi:hypothetical protein ACEWY4_020738 [Coilia grayii]|uniref:G protein-regulated inducer of neurite outgrowth C-terminal domain-containing protein n=1 Tax=Coilia grayii TaxID=363190 RepID=A0ABD1J9G4_9TELE
MNMSLKGTLFFSAVLHRHPMAERVRPVSEHFPAEGSSPTEPGPITDTLALSKSSTDMVTTSPQLDKVSQGPHGASSLPTGAQNGSQPTLKLGAHSANSTPDHLVVRNPGRPHSIAESHGMEVLLEGELNHHHHPHHHHPHHLHAPPCCGDRGLGSSGSHRDLSAHMLAPAMLPVHRSHSDTLQTLSEGPAPHLHPHLLQHPHPHCDTPASMAAPVPATSPSHLAHLPQERRCELQPCAGAMCMPGVAASALALGRGPSPTSAGQPQHGCIPVALSNVPCEGAAEVRHPRYEELTCCGGGGGGSFGVAVGPGAVVEETLAAYCHYQPIPAAVQLLTPPARGLPGTEAQLLALPRLISSISETGLDAKRTLRCCSLDCPWPHAPTLTHAGSQPHVGDEGRATVTTTTTATATATRDTGTMTSRLELRDVGVQAEVASGTPPPPLHMYPEVCLMEDGANYAATAAVGTGKGKAKGKGRGGASAAAQKSPVKEVKWDAEGMTWEVYGASVDPEELGLAIQKHLELQIKETASRAAKLSRQNTSGSDGGGARRRKKRAGGLMGSLRGSLRGPGCCTRSSTTVD